MRSPFSSIPMAQIAAVSLIVLGFAGDLHAADPKAPAQSQSQSQSQAGVPGVWLDDKGEGAIELAPCAQRLCGHIVWLKDPLDARSQPLLDENNPEPAKRKRTICGMPMIGDLKFMGPNVYDLGWIYDPKEGKAYDLEVTMLKGDRLQIKGYLRSKLLSESFIWTRAPEGLPRCDGAKAS